MRLCRQIVVSRANRWKQMIGKRCGADGADSHSLTSNSCKVAWCSTQARCRYNTINARLGVCNFEPSCGFCI